MITSKTYLDPVLPENLPDSIIQAADLLPRKAEFLAGRLANETSKQLVGLLRITNTYFSNLIEGHRTEIADLQAARTATSQERKGLKDLAVQHMTQQEVMERQLRMRPVDSFSAIFDPNLIAAIHRRLFKSASREELTLDDGRMMEPGRLRAEENEQVQVGAYVAPAASAVMPMLQHLQLHYGRIKDPRRQLIAALAGHHRLALVHPFLDGNGRVIRMLTHLQLVYLGLKPFLWSLSRGLARRQDEYYRFLALADRPREGDHDGRGQLSQRHYFTLIEFMLDVCRDQIEYMTTSLNPARLREQVVHAFSTDPELRRAGIRPTTAAAVLALLTQGAMPRAEFKVFTGLKDRLATEELSQLIKAGIVVSSTPRSRMVEAGLSAHFAGLIFPNLHFQMC
ncbi:Fic family protein [Pseudomonas protegens]|uniref:Fic family protein n=1 Tax=Pseudomonas protegens TaxID=380021 RepID=A0A7G7XC14_9PSED|nr:Fic family protein [Pseudomonas protegens]QNH77509.1 Fic family protein [Pseudomonas protegens]QNL06705.1 Fic family protein [Pseudomonas protegens]